MPVATKRATVKNVENIVDNQYREGQEVWGMRREEIKKDTTVSEQNYAMYKQPSTVPVSQPNALCRISYYSITVNTIVTATQYNILHYAPG